MTDTQNIDFPGYTLHSTLGRGGLSTVYLADQKVFERPVAFKVMSAKMAQRGGFGKRFLREVRIVASLNHRNIVQVYDTGEAEGNYYLAMEYLPKGDLAALTGKPFAPRDALRIVSSVLEALEFAASRGVVHRDVKPANVMFREDDTVVLVDFGIAFRDVADERLTSVGTIIGTPHYMSPEQFEGGDVDERSDIYSVGIMLFELLTGDLPFDADSAVTVGIQHVSQPIPRLPPALAPFQEIIDTALAKHPDERYASATAFLAALAGLSGSVYAGSGLARDPTRVDDPAGESPVGGGVVPAAGSAAPRMSTETGPDPARASPMLAEDVTGPLVDGVRAPARRTGLGTRDRRASAIPRGAALGVSTPMLAAIGVTLLAALVLGWLALRTGGGARPAPVDVPVASRSDSAAAGENVLQSELATRRDALIARIALLQPLARELTATWIVDAYARLLAMQTAPEEIDAGESQLQTRLAGLLQTADRRFTAGSTPEQIAAAFATCRQYDPSCERSWYASETLREVVLSPFRLQRSEVTVAEFAEFVAATGFVTDAERRGFSYAYSADGVREVPALSWRRPFPGDGELAQNLPVVHISSADAQAYCRWRGGRLPTAEEWEYAARGPERRIYPWGDRWDDKRAPLQTDRPEPAGSLQQDAFFSGLTEMTGNVWEWVSLGAGEFGLKGGSHREFHPANMRTPVRREELAGVTLSDDGMRCAFDAQRWPATRGLSLRGRAD